MSILNMNNEYAAYLRTVKSKIRLEDNWYFLGFIEELIQNLRRIKLC